MFAMEIPVAEKQS